MSTYTTKEWNFIKAKLSGLGNEEAAIQAGYSPKSARTQATNLMKKPEILEAIGITVKDLGISFQEALKPFKDALKATKQTLDKQTGEYYDSGLPDHTARMAAAKQLLKMQGYDRSLRDTEPPIHENELKPTPNKTLNMKNIDEIEMQRVILRPND